MTADERVWERLRSETRGFRDRRITAMMRVRNEAEFLEPAVRSIAPLVDEIVIVDNASTDGSADVIAALARRFRKRIVTFHYPYTIGRVGAETWALSESGGRSPRLSARYYNWCLARCTGPYVLKWDGDMVALDGLASAIAAWRRSERQVLVMHGVNVHHERRHAIAAASADREALLTRLAVPGLPRWVTSPTFDYPEPRLFPKRFARYTTRIRWTQELATPFLAVPLRARAVETLAAPAYLHLKFCKRDPVAIYTPDLARVIRENVVRGPRLSRPQAATLRRWGLAPGAAARATARPQRTA